MHSNMMHKYQYHDKYHGAHFSVLPNSNLDTITYEDPLSATPLGFLHASLINYLHAQALPCFEIVSLSTSVSN